jgi:hypothetical protein
LDAQTARSAPALGKTRKWKPVAAPPATVPALLALLDIQHLLVPAQLEMLGRLHITFPDVPSLGGKLVEMKWLTPWQVKYILHGKADGLRLGRRRTEARPPPWPGSISPGLHCPNSVQSLHLPYSTSRKYP